MSLPENTTEKSFAAHTFNGQHLLIDNQAIDTIVGLVPDNGSCTEIGPGNGALTGPLLQKGVHVTGYEIDKRCEPALVALSGNGNLHMRWLSFLDVPPREINDKDIIIGNIPFNISEPLIKKLANLTFTSAVLMFGRNFADALTAPSPSNDRWSRMSLYGRGLFEITRVLEVPKTSFDPIPRVDATVLRLTRLDAMQRWRRDPVARSYRALLDTDDSKGSVAQALKTIIVRPDGSAEARIAGRPVNRRAERRITNQGMRMMASDWNAGYTPERPRRETPGEEMFKLVRDTLDDRNESLLSKPLSGLTNDEVRIICSAITTVVNKRTKKR